MQDELEPIFPQGMLGSTHLQPWFYHVADLAVFNVFSRVWYPVVSGTLGFHGRLPRAHYDVWLIEGGIYGFTMDRDVFSGVHEFLLFSIEFISSGLCVPGSILLCLLPTDYPGVSSVHHQGWDPVCRIGLQFLNVVTLRGLLEVDYPLEICLYLALLYELEVIGKPIVPGYFSQGGGYPSRHLHIVAGVQD